MKELLRFLASYDVGIYLLLGAVALICIFRFISAWLAKRNAYYGLEREVVQSKMRSSMAILAITILLALTQFMLISVLSIRFPGFTQIATPTLNINFTPTVPLTEVAGEMVTPQGYEVTQTAIAITGCVPGQLEWIFPQSGDEVSGSVELKATVNVPNQGFYKYEYQQVGKEEWHPIASGSKTIIEENLGGRWNTELVTPGNYYLRLVVLDNVDNPLKPCTIEVKVIPT